MKKMFDEKEKIVRTIWEKWKKVLRPIKTMRDYDYWDLQDTDIVLNPIIGVASVGKIRQLQARGVIVFRNCWRVPTEECNNYEGLKRIKASSKYELAKKLNFDIQEYDRQTSLN
jgi:hypothetical protein